MPTHKSAKKRVRGNERKRVHNRNRMSAVRTAVKTFRASVAALRSGGATDVKKVEELLSNAQKLLAKAAKTGTIHSRNAERMISRLALRLNDAIKNVGVELPKAVRGPSKRVTAAKAKAARAAKAKKTKR